MKSIKQNSLFDLVQKKTTPTTSTDKDISFVKDIYSTVKTKEDLGITTENLIEKGSEFPANPVEEQIFIKDGRMYIYKRN